MRDVKSHSDCQPSLTSSWTQAIIVCESAPETVRKLTGSAA
jgi:hypothetical protein